MSTEPHESMFEVYRLRASRSRSWANNIAPKMPCEGAEPFARQWSWINGQRVPGKSRAVVSTGALGCGDHLIGIGNAAMFVKIKAFQFTFLGYAQRASGFDRAH